MELNLPDSLRGMLERSPNLPTLPVVGAKLIDLAKDPNTELCQISELIQHDPAIAGKVLRISNSPLYLTAAGKVSNIERAITLLGFDTTVSLALSFSVLDKFNKSQKFIDLSKVWRRSVLAAASAEAIARLAKIKDKDALFLGSLMQDLGILGLCQVIPSTYGALVGKSNHEQWTAEEIKETGVDHALVSAWLLQRWELPESLWMSVAYSHNPGDAPEEHAHLASAITLAGDLADIVQQDHDDLTGVLERASQTLPINGTHLDFLIEDLANRLSEIEQLFDVDLSAIGSTDELVKKARATLLETSARAESD